MEMSFKGVRHAFRQAAGGRDQLAKECKLYKSGMLGIKMRSLEIGINGVGR